MFDFFIKNVNFFDGCIDIDIVVSGGKIVVVEVGIVVEVGEVIDVMGWFVLLFFVDLYFYMDVILLFGFLCMNVLGMLLEGI